MKIKVLANELVDTDIEMVSLVRHGANRCPFKVVKTDDEESLMDKVGEKLANFLTISSNDEPRVITYFVKEDKKDEILPVLKKHGIDIDSATVKDGIVIIKGEGGKQKGFLQLSDYVAIAISHPLDEFQQGSIVKTYSDRLGFGGFAPGVRLATDVLAEVVWSVLNSNEESGKAARVEKVDEILSSYSEYIKSVSELLPDTVFKLEAELGLAKTEETVMPKGDEVKDTTKDDLDGLDLSSDKVEKSEEIKAAPEAEKPVEKAEEAQEETVEVAAEAVEKYDDQQLFDEDEEAEEQEDRLQAALEAIEALTKSVSHLTEQVERQAVEKQELERKVATTTVVKNDNMDFALSSLGGGHRPAKEVVKSGEELWDGLFSDLNTFRSSR